MASKSTFLCRWNLRRLHKNCAGQTTATLGRASARLMSWAARRVRHGGDSCCPMRRRELPQRACPPRVMDKARSCPNCGEADFAAARWACV